MAVEEGIVSYAARTYDNEHGDPVVVLVVTGTHDVSRIVQALTAGNCEQSGLGERIVKMLKRHNKGRLALALLKAHGGADFTDAEDAPLVEGIKRAQGIPT